MNDPPVLLQPHVRSELQTYLSELRTADPRPTWRLERERGMVSGIDQVFHFFFDDHDFDEAGVAAYPIAEDMPVVAQWGYDMQSGDDLILRIEVAPADKRGNLVVRFEIADDDDARNRVRGSFLTTYPDLDAFRLDIAKLMDNGIEEAILIGR